MIQGLGSEGDASLKLEVAERTERGGLAYRIAQRLQRVQRLEQRASRRGGVTAIALSVAHEEPDQRRVPCFA